GPKGTASSHGRRGCQVPTGFSGLLRGAGGRILRVVGDLHLAESEARRFGRPVVAAMGTRPLDRLHHDIREVVLDESRLLAGRAGRLATDDLGLVVVLARAAGTEQLRGRLLRLL